MKLLLMFILVSPLAFCNQIQNRSNEIPSFDLQLDSINHFNTTGIPLGSPIVLIYFSPDCDHCFKETKDLLQNIKYLQSVRFYFITNDSFAKIRPFKDYFKISRYPNILVARDYSYFFPAHFKSAMIPYHVLYDRNKQCRAIYCGEITADTLINFIRKL